MNPPGMYKAFHLRPVVSKFLEQTKFKMVCFLVGMIKLLFYVLRDLHHLLQAWVHSFLARVEIDGARGSQSHLLKTK